VDNYGGRTYAYDVPATVDQLGYLQDGDVIICTPAEIAHVKRVAEAANVDMAAIRERSKGDDTLELFRNEVRSAARDEDLSAQLLVLQPLFDELSPAEVAAALSALLRARRPQRAEKASRDGSTGGAPKTWARLFVSIGERDEVSARDIVGAITGEAGITGSEVGKVEVRDTFSVIEIASGSADRVIKALNGTTMKGRSLRVDYDRKSGPGSGGDRQPRNDRPPRGDRPPRRPEGARGGAGTGSGPRSGPPRGGPSRGGPSRGGPPRSGPTRGGPSRGGPSRGGPSRGGPPRGGRDSGTGRPARGGGRGNSGE
jgi:ATP-dependent RNA helicase DeaD